MGNRKGALVVKLVHETMGNCLNCKMSAFGAIASGFQATRDPQPDDVVVCVQCGHVMVFNRNMAFDELSDADIIRIAGDPRLVDLQRERPEMHRRLEQLLAKEKKP